MSHIVTGIPKCLFSVSVLASLQTGDVLWIDICVQTTLRVAYVRAQMTSAESRTPTVAQARASGWARS